MLLLLSHDTNPLRYTTALTPNTFCYLHGGNVNICFQIFIQWLKHSSVPWRKWKPLVSYIFSLCSLIFNSFFPKETATTAICLGLHCSSIHMQKTIYLRARRVGFLSHKESSGYQQTSSAGMWHPVSAVVHSGHNILISWEIPHTLPCPFRDAFTMTSLFHVIRGLILLLEHHLHSNPFPSETK